MMRVEILGRHDVTTMLELAIWLSARTSASLRVPPSRRNSALTLMPTGRLQFALGVEPVCAPGLREP